MFGICFVLILLGRANYAQLIPPGCEVTTTTGYRYSNFHHLHSNPSGDMEIRFRVMAKSDAHIALTTSPLVLNPLYEIVIGASGNNYTDLRRTMTGRSVSAVKTPLLLSESEFRGFWIAVRRGEVEVGREGETLPYFHWKDPDPLPVHYYSLSSWTGTVAKWIQKCNFSGPNSWLSPDNSSSADESVPSSNSAEYYNTDDKLRANLFRNYNKEVRPSTYHKSPITISLSYTLIHFELSEISSRMAFHGWIRMSWRDERLAWNESDYENTTLIHVPSHYLWQPDLALYNNANAGDMVHFEVTNALVYPDGSVTIVPPVSFETLCNLDLRYWPYDAQSCDFKLGSWSHDGDRINLDLYNNQSEIDTSSYDYNLQWELVSANATILVETYECCPTEKFPSAIFTLVIRRTSPLFRATIVAPAVVIVLLTLVAFILPPNSIEKILIGLVDLLVLSIYLLYFSIILPPMGDHLPFIVSFYSHTLVLVAVSVMLAVLTIVLIRTPIQQGPPYFIQNLLLGLPGRLLGLSHLIALVHKGETVAGIEVQHSADYSLHVDESQLVSPEEGRHGVPHPINKSKTRSRGSGRCFEGLNRHELEWVLLACALDRIALAIYIIAFVLMTATSVK